MCQSGVLEPILKHDSDSTLMTWTQVMGTQLGLFFGDSDSNTGDSRLHSDSRFSDSTTTLEWCYV